MIETPRAALRGRRDRRGGRLLLLRDQRPHPDDLRVQPRRRRGPDDARLPRAGLLKRNPFETIDQAGVGELVRCGRRGAGRPSPTSSSASAASTAATPSRSTFLRGRPRLRELLAVPGADRPAGRRPGGPGSSRVRRGGTRRSHAPDPAMVGGRRYRLAHGHPGRGRGPGPGGHRHRGPDQRAHGPAQGRPALDRPLPVPHREDPSFSVNAEEGFYYCFGCQAKGDAITFVRAIEHLDFVDAVEGLADRAGITLHETTPSRAGTTSGRPGSTTPWSRRSTGTTSGCSPRPTPPRPGATCARGATTATWCASSGWAGRPTVGTIW